MRDLLITILVFGSLPLILKRPYIGVLVWAWLSYMNPHRLAWGYAYDMPFAQLVAITLFISLLFSKEKKKIPVDTLLVVWIIFVIWMSITTIFALHDLAAFEYYQRMIKIQILTFITMICMSNQKRLDMLIWVICLSIGFFSIKGGLFTIMSAGKFRVYGPPDSFISENNALALAVLMVIPLMCYLFSMATKKWLKYGLAAAIFLSALAALGSQSRGALVAMAALAGYFWLQSKGKLVSGMAIIVVAFLTLSFMPDTWSERMESIQNYQEDASALARIDAWKYSIGVANKRLTGGGFNSFSLRNYATYYQPVKQAFVAHSIYFSVLAAHGWPGLVMFLSILLMTWWNLSRVTSQSRGDPLLKHYYVLSRMLTLSLIVYMAGGAFLSLAYFDLPWHIVAIAYLLKHQLGERVHPKSTPVKIGNISRSQVR